MTVAMHAIALVAALVALRFWTARPDAVLREIDVLDLDPAVKAAIKADCEVARRADRRTWPYDLSAPLVTLVALMFTSREADKLPRWAKRWDNNVSLNGDGRGWYKDGRLVDVRTEEPPSPETPTISHNDPAFDAVPYYVPEWLRWLPLHLIQPRGFVARWVWVGWRNRASQLSLDVGVPVTARPVCISGDPTIHRRGPYGHFVLEHGGHYHYKSMRRSGRFTVIRSYGHKLEIPFKEPDGIGQGRAAAIATGFSFKRWKG